MLVINNNKKIVRILYIYYLICIYQNKIWDLFINKSKINIMNPKFAWKLSFKAQKTNIRVQKINSFALKTFKPVIANF